MSQALTVAQKVNNVRSLLNSDAVKNQIAKALPQHVTAERMIRVIMTGIQKTPKLADCTQYSLLAAIVQASELGLEPNTPLGLSYIIPYGQEATFQIGYRGFLALARRSGEISYAVAEIVYKNDRFELHMGTDRRIIHVPLLTGDRGDKIGVYSLVQYKDGTTDFEYMTHAQVIAVKTRSKAASSGPWKTDEDEMWRKTPMRRHAKRWPMSVEDANKIGDAVVRDEYTDYGITHSGDMVGLPDPPTVISEDQRVALVDAARESQSDLGAILEQAGFAMLANITIDKYDDILKSVTKKKSGKKGETVDGEIVTDRPIIGTQPPNDPDPVDDDEPTDLERKRATVQTLFADLDKQTRERLLPPGSKLIKERNVSELDRLLADIEKEQEK